METGGADAAGLLRTLLSFDRSTVRPELGFFASGSTRYTDAMPIPSTPGDFGALEALSIQLALRGKALLLAAGHREQRTLSPVYKPKMPRRAKLYCAVFVHLPWEFAGW